MAQNSFSYFQLEEKHFKDVQFLFKVVFNKRYSITYLKNKYSDYLQVGMIATIAYDGEKPIGFYGAVPQKFMDRGQEILVAHACDSYTLKEYQGKGVHYHLAKLSYSLMTNKNFHFVYAFHSENTYHSTKKLGWKELESLVRFHLHTGSKPFAKVYKKLKLQKWYQKRVKKALEPYLKNDCQIKIASKGQIMDNSFFQYKELLFPHHLIEIEECVFYLKVDAILHVGFLKIPYGVQLKLALQKLTEIARKLGVSEILFQCSKNSHMFSVLELELKPQPSWIIGYLPFRDIEIGDFEFTYADLDTF